MYKHILYIDIFTSTCIIYIYSNLPLEQKKKIMSIQSLKQVRGVRELDSLEAELQGGLSTLGGALDLQI